MTVMERIRELVNVDMQHKSLIELQNQLMTEVGELSQALNYECRIFGALHRDPPNEPAFNEAIDVVICGLAMAYALEESSPGACKKIEEIAHFKLDKWAKKQQENVDIVENETHSS